MAKLKNGKKTQARGAQGAGVTKRRKLQLTQQQRLAVYTAVVVALGASGITVISPESLDLDERDKEGSAKKKKAVVSYAVKLMSTTTRSGYLKFMPHIRAPGVRAVRNAINFWWASIVSTGSTDQNYKGNSGRPIKNPVPEKELEACIREVVSSKCTSQPRMADGPVVSSVLAKYGLKIEKLVEQIRKLVPSFGRCMRTEQKRALNPKEKENRVLHAKRMFGLMPMQLSNGLSLRQQVRCVWMVVHARAWCVYAWGGGGWWRGDWLYVMQE